MKTKTILAFTMFSVLIGCVQQNTKPEIHPDNHRRFATMWNLTHLCYDSDIYSVEEHASYKESISQAWYSWKVAKEDIDSEIKENYEAAIKAFDSGEYSLPVICKDWKTQFTKLVKHIELVNEENRRRMSQQAAQQQYYNNNSSNNFVNPIRSTTQCKSMNIMNNEIKTVSGLVCPIGWVPVPFQ